MPGYTPPASLDKQDKDAMWLPTSPKDPRVVWDGFCATALFELIRESLDPAGTSPYIKVVNAETKKIVEDLRDPEIMAMRPIRAKGLGPRGVYNHLVEVLYWAEMLPSGDRTRTIIQDILGDRKDATATEDGYTRSRAFMDEKRQDHDPWEYQEDVLRRAEADEIKLRPLCMFGPAIGADRDRLIRDKDVPLLALADKYTLSHDPLKIEDFRATGRPESYYRAAAEKGRRRREEERKIAAATLRQVEDIDDRERHGSGSSGPVSKDKNPF